MADTELVHTLALACLPGVGPRRLRALRARHGAAEAWRLVCAGAPARTLLPDRPTGGPDLFDRWRDSARAIDPEATFARHRRAGITVLARGLPGYPAVLADDLDPPELVCAQGDLAHLDVPLVSIVGTRRATRYGFDVARRLGRELAAAGAGVVSGLALGIDGAAHLGCLAADQGAPVAVVGSGLDVVYPARNRSLWADVARRGLLLSEAPLGTRPEAWRFPARNRIIAALGRALVVVESPERGGSMLTVDEALARDRPVLAVPGPVTSRASAGTNRLLADGAAPALDVSDVLREVRLDGPAGAGRDVSPTAPGLEPGAVVLLEALGWEPTGLDELAGRVDMTPGEVAGHLTRLELAGLVERRGLWLERVSS